jgi:hypothetical protein
LRRLPSAPPLFARVDIAAVQAPRNQEPPS